jgi:SPP1 gp7 family putative phage head morphogenesis protein
MAVPEQLINSEVRHQVMLERLKADEAGKVDSFLREIDQSIRDRLSSADELSTFQRGRLQSLLDEVRNLSREALTRFNGQLSDRLQALAESETGFEARAIENVLQGTSVTTPAASQAWTAIAAAPLSVRGAQGGQLLDEMLSEFTEDQVERISGRIRQGAFEGQTNSEIIRSIRGTQRRGFRDGVLGTTRRHASAIVSTGVQHVASEARAQTWAANSDIVTGYRWVSTLDSKTTQICRSLDGRVFQMGEGPKPPVHVNCRSTTAPELDDGLDFLDQDATRASAQGPVDADQTYYSWLKKQPARFQDDAIGPKRAKLLRDGGLSSEEFSRLNLGRNFEPLTLEEMKAREPVAFERAEVAA